MKIEVIQTTTRDGDTPYNLSCILKDIAQCAPDTDVVLFPESHLTGFLSQEDVGTLSESVDGEAVQAVVEAARQRNVAVVLGLYENAHGTFYNTTLFIAPEGILLTYRKTHLWVPEHGIVVPGDRFSTVEWRGVRIGLLICYDSEFPETARALMALDAQVMLITDGLAEPEDDVHRVSVMARAMENRCSPWWPIGWAMGRTTACSSATVWGRPLWQDAVRGRPGRVTAYRDPGSVADRQGPCLPRLPRQPAHRPAG